jgi:hypothetical protein
MDIRLKNEAYAIAQVLYGAGICMLIVLGMSGAIYKVVGPHGMLERAFGAALTGEFTLLIALIVVSAFGWAGRLQISERLRGRMWGGTTYLFGMLGVLFAVRLATFGIL